MATGVPLTVTLTNVVDAVRSHDEHGMARLVAIRSPVMTPRTVITAEPSPKSELSVQLVGSNWPQVPSAVTARFAA
jgi:hypothetical protein